LDKRYSRNRMLPLFSLVEPATKRQKSMRIIIFQMLKLLQ
jgi:hypothetical protein